MSNDALNGKGLDFETLKLEDGLIVQMKPLNGSNYILALELSGANPGLTIMFEALLAVAAINGQPQPKPTTRAKMDALSDRVGRKGIDAIVAWYQAKAYPELTEVNENLPEGVDRNSPEALKLAEEKRLERLKKSPEIQ